MSATPRRTIRVPDASWDAGLAEAERRGEDLSAAVRRFLDAYGAGVDMVPPLPPGDGRWRWALIWEQE